MLAYLGAMRSNSRVAPALVSNPMARTNWRSVAHARLVSLMSDPRACLETPSPDALGQALNYLLFERHANVVVVNGGDGTIHHTLNAAVRVVTAASAVIGKPVPLPRFLFVRGGGMNMLARVFRTRGHPVRTLERFTRRARGARLGTLPTRGVPLLGVTEPDGSERLGYIFGSELVFNAMTMYERFGQGYPGLARFLWEVARGYAFRTALWHRYEHLLDAPETPLVIDGEVYPRYTSVVATTVPLQLVKGVIATVREMSAPGTMNAVAVLATDKGEVIRRIPQLMLGAPAAGVTYRHDVGELAVYGPYTLDGERVDRLNGNQAAPLRVRGTRWVVDGIWLA
ncbi:MAG: hypothetical protein CVU56_15490 [Deltaproteobacteria bacterium HGW-Deltaproteobacteria-14]|nr:MAG: hypothetical protein CVU56_15490 [Deltaproteobacteria bacterium HGW-Deltaproteobacteria-14]